MPDAALRDVWQRDHLQCSVSAVASIMKKDIYAVFLEFVTCGCAGGELSNLSGSFRISFKQKEEGIEEHDEESDMDERKEVGGLHAENSAAHTKNRHNTAHKANEPNSQNEPHLASQKAGCLVE